MSRTTPYIPLSASTGLEAKDSDARPLPRSLTLPLDLIPINPQIAHLFEEYIKESVTTTPSWRSSIPVVFIASTLTYAYWGNGTAAMKLLEALTPLDSKLADALALVLNLSISGSNFFIPFALFPAALREVTAQTLYPRRDAIRVGKRLTGEKLFVQSAGVISIAALATISISSVNYSNMSSIDPQTAFIKALLTLPEAYLFVEFGNILLKHLKLLRESYGREKSASRKKTENDIENPLEDSTVHLRLSSDTQHHFVPETLKKHLNQLALRVLQRLITGMKEHLDQLGYDVFRKSPLPENIAALVNDIVKSNKPSINSTAWTKMLILLESVTPPETTLTRISTLQELMTFQRYAPSSVKKSLLEKIQQQNLCLRLLGLPVEIPYRLVAQGMVPLLNKIVPHGTIINLLVNACMIEFAIAFFLPVFNVPEQLPTPLRLALAILTAASATLLSTVLISWGNNRSEKIETLLSQLWQGKLPQIYPPEIDPRSVKGVSYGIAFLSASLTLSLAYTSVCNSLLTYGLDPQDAVARLWFIDEFDNPFPPFFREHKPLAALLLLIIPAIGTLIFNNLANKMTSKIIFGFLDKLILYPLRSIGNFLFTVFGLNCLGIKDKLDNAQKRDESIKKFQQLRKLVDGEQDLLSSMINAQGNMAVTALLIRFTDALIYFCKNNSEELAQEELAQKVYELIGKIANMRPEATKELFALQLLFAKHDESLKAVISLNSTLTQNLLTKYQMTRTDVVLGTYGATEASSDILSINSANTESTEPPASGYSTTTFDLSFIGDDFYESDATEQNEPSICQRVSNSLFRFFCPCVRKQENSFNKPVVFEYEQESEKTRLLLQHG